MKLPEALLWVTSVLFMAFGVAFAMAPQQGAEFATGARPSLPSALIDMRATYGGMALGIGLFLGLCARRPSWVRTGLSASLLTVAAIGSARLLGIIVDGSPNAIMLSLLATEASFSGLYVIALRRVG
ncbi:MAG: DUF4345 domain-containing protein [bacterium]